MGIEILKLFAQGLLSAVKNEIMIFTEKLIDLEIIHWVR